VEGGREVTNLFKGAQAIKLWEPLGYAKVFRGLLMIPQAVQSLKWSLFIHHFFISFDATQLSKLIHSR
jgi:hypothetical protein